MESYLNAESLAAYALGQRRGFILGVVCGAALVVYSTRYKTVRRVPKHRTAAPGFYRPSDLR